MSDPKGLGKWVGEYNPDGSIKVDAVECAFTHTPVKGIHAVRERVANTLYFYRVKSDHYRRFSDEARAALQAEIAGAQEIVKPEKKKESANG